MVNKVNVAPGSYEIQRHNAELAALWCEQAIADIELKLELIQWAFVKSITHPPKLYDYTTSNLFSKFHQPKLDELNDTWKEIITLSQFAYPLRH